MFIVRILANYTNIIAVWTSFQCVPPLLIFLGGAVCDIKPKKFLTSYRLPSRYFISSSAKNERVTIRLERMNETLIGHDALPHYSLDAIRVVGSAYNARWSHDN